MLVRGVVDNQLGDDAQITAVGLAQEVAKVTQRAVRLVHVGIVGDIVAIVPKRRWIKRQQPDGADPQVLQVIELLRQPDEVADPVAAAIVVGLDVQLVDDRVFVPTRVAVHRSTLAALEGMSRST